MKSLLALAVLCTGLLPGISTAGVIYKWTNIDGSTPKNVQLTIEVDEEAVERGNLQVNFSPNGFPGNIGLTSPLIYMYYSSGDGPGITYSRDRVFFPTGSLNLNFTFHNDGFLSGGFNYLDGFSDINMSGGKDWWKVNYTNSDAPIKPCGGDKMAACDARGYIRRVDMPEPGTFALLGIGAIALVRRRVRT